MNKRIALLVAIVGIWAVAVGLALVLARSMGGTPAPAAGPLTTNPSPTVSQAPEPDFGVADTAAVVCTPVPDDVMTQVAALARPGVQDMRGIQAWTVFEPQIADRVYVAMQFTTADEPAPLVGVWGVDAFRAGAQIWPAEAVATEFTASQWSRTVFGPLDGDNIADALSCFER